MAWISARQLSDGTTSYTVQWRDARGRKPSEPFALAPDNSNDPADEARRFKLLTAPDATVAALPSSSTTRQDYAERICADGFPLALRRRANGRDRWFTDYVSHPPSL